MAVLTASVVFATEPTIYKSVPDPPSPYESLNIVLFQDFFDKLTADFIAPLVKDLPNVNLTKIIPD